MAAIDYDAGTWRAEHMNVFAQALGRVAGNGRESEMTAEEFIILVKEMAARAALTVEHGHRWTNRIVCAAWDNMNVVQALRTRQSRNAAVRYFLFIITRCEIHHKFSLLGFFLSHTTITLRTRSRGCSEAGWPKAVTTSPSRRCKHTSTRILAGHI